MTFLELIDKHADGIGGLIVLALLIVLWTRRPNDDDYEDTDDTD